MVILPPFTIIFRQWYKMSILQALLSFGVHFLFSSTFIASWYLMALLIGTTIILLASRRVSNKVLFVLSFVVYLLCCAWSGYGKLLGLPVIGGWPKIYNSFPVSFIWLMIGKLIAENKIECPKQKYSFLAAAATVYIAEYLICIHFNWMNCTDPLITMIPICAMLFLVVKEVNIELGRRASILRQFSTVTYCLHASVGVSLKAAIIILFHANLDSGMWRAVRYLLTIIICIIATWMIRKLERKARIFGLLY